MAALLLTDVELVAVVVVVVCGGSGEVTTSRLLNADADAAMRVR